MGATELKTIRVRYSIPGAVGVRKVVIWHAIVFILPKVYKYIMSYANTSRYVWLATPNLNIHVYTKT